MLFLYLSTVSVLISIAKNISYLRDWVYSNGQRTWILNSVRFIILALLFIGFRTLGKWLTSLSFPY